MAYDAADHETVLFGGMTPNDTGLNDTWVFKNGTWAEVNATVAPPARELATMTYDARDGYILLFGGWQPNGPVFNDTWSFRAGHWTDLTSSLRTLSPSTRWGAEMVYDAADRYVVLFGGFPDHRGYGTDDQTWAYANRSWTDLTPSLNVSPPSRMFQGMAFDNASHTVVMFAGSECIPSMCDAYGGFPLDDTWSYSGGNWTNLTPARSPTVQSAPQMTYDVAGGYILLESGQGTTWTFANGTWTELNLSITPGVRLEAGFTFDASLNAPVLVDGANASYDASNLAVTGFRGVYNDSWVFVGPSSTVPLAARLTAPSAVDANSTASFSVQVSGGSGAYVTAFHGLPPPCNDSGTATVVCRPAVVGSYNVSVTARDSSGNSTAVAALVSILPGPHISVASSPAAIDPGQSVTFRVTEGGGEAPYAVDYTGLPSGCAPAAPEFSCTVGTPGIYSVEARLTDSLGIEASSAPATFTVAAPLAVVNLSALPLAGLPRSVLFTLEATGGLAPYTYAFAFGDGTSVTVSVPSAVHDYLATGAYPASATVTDSSGETRSASVRVTIPAPPALLTAAISIATVYPSEGRPLVIAATVAGSDAPVSYAWSGLPLGCASANSSSLTCTPLEAGRFDVRLVASAASESASALVQLSLASPLGVNLSSAVVEGCGEPAVWLLDASVTGGYGPMALVWTFSDGVTVRSNLTSVSHVLGPTATSTVNVSVVDASGATASGSATTLAPTPASCPPAPSPSPFTSLAALFLATTILAAGAAVTLVVLRRRK